MEKSFIEMQLVYLIDFFEANLNVACDRFVTDSVNETVKNKPKEISKTLAQ